MATTKLSTTIAGIVAGATGATGPTGATGTTGPTGPTGQLDLQEPQVQREPQAILVQLDLRELLVLEQLVLQDLRGQQDLQALLEYSR
jgi:hypothetical protein